MASNPLISAAAMQFVILIRKKQEEFTMPMQMGFRWYGEGNDQITLDYIKQIPGVSTIVWALHHKMPGEIWEEHEIAEVMDQLHKYGFNGDVVESVNVHDDIKIGKPNKSFQSCPFSTSLLRLLSEWVA